MTIRYHRRSKVYAGHVLRLFRPIGGGIGIVVWRHEIALVPTPETENDR